MYISLLTVITISPNSPFKHDNINEFFRLRLFSKEPKNSLSLKLFILKFLLYHCPDISRKKHIPRFSLWHPHIRHLDRFIRNSWIVTYIVTIIVWNFRMKNCFLPDENEYYKLGPIYSSKLTQYFVHSPLIFIH